jgi:Flp pilus assembly pilin Flp
VDQPSGDLATRGRLGYAPSKITGLFVKVREYQRGQTMTEYGLILAAIAVVCIAGYDLIGSSVSGVLVSVNAGL